MDKKLKAKWVKALRSGKYEQSQGYLKDELDEGRFGFCCLGVLRDVISPKSNLRGDADEEVCIADNEGGEHLHPKHAKLAGLTPPQQTKLAEANDQGKSFKWIAGYIQRYL